MSDNLFVYINSNPIERGRGSPLVFSELHSAIHTAQMEHNKAAKEGGWEVIDYLTWSYIPTLAVYEGKGSAIVPVSFTPYLIYVKEVWKNPVMISGKRVRSHDSI